MYSTQERTDGNSILLKEYMQTLQLSATKRKRQGALAESSSQTSCDYVGSDSNEGHTAEKRLWTRRKQGAGVNSMPRTRNGSHHISAYGMLIFHFQLSSLKSTPDINLEPIK